MLYPLDQSPAADIEEAVVEQAEVDLTSRAHYRSRFPSSML